MQRSYAFTFSWLVALGASACGNPNTTPDTSSGGGGAGATSTTSSSSTGQGGAGLDLTCDDYCDRIMAGCIDGNQQYPSREACMSTCATFPLGSLDDTRGDTLGCRIYQLGFLALAADTKCAHGGPSGGDLRGGPEGICGDGCEAFCALEASACAGSEAQYATTAECLASCDLFPGPQSTDDFDVGDQSGDTFNCRLYHLVAATTDPATHCPHTAPSEVEDPCSGP